MTAGYTCAVCGLHHEGLPTDVGYQRPERWDDLDEDTRSRSWLTDDACVIDDRWFFIRALLYVPHEDNGAFGWGVWAELDSESFRGVFDRWDDPPPPTPRRIPCSVANELQNDIPFYSATLGLPGYLIERGPTLRPTIELEPGDHPLVGDQRDGLTRARYEELAHQVLDRFGGD